MPTGIFISITTPYGKYMVRHLTECIDTAPHPIGHGFGEAGGASGTAVSRAEGNEARVGCKTVIALIN